MNKKQSQLLRQLTVATNTAHRQFQQAAAKSRAAGIPYYIDRKDRAWKHYIKSAAALHRVAVGYGVAKPSPAVRRHRNASRMYKATRQPKYQQARVRAHRDWMADVIRFHAVAVGWYGMRM